MGNRGGILEVLLVSAEGIKNPNILGKSSYYVILKCGNQAFTSRITSVIKCFVAGGNKKALWNEKFAFIFSISDWKKLTHLKFKIMDKEVFSGGTFIGETTVHLGGILTEGNDKGFIELKPAPYNVVLDDDTYKGEIKVGLKYTPNVELPKKREFLRQKQLPQPIYKRIFKFWQLPLSRAVMEDYVQLDDHSTFDSTGYSTLSGNDSFAYCRTSSETSAFSNPTDDNSCSDELSSHWPTVKSLIRSQVALTRLGMKRQTGEDNSGNQDAANPELETMKERFSKLLLGEDMSGSGKGVCTAVAISNSITNLYATVFGQNLRLEPLPLEKKSMWRREMDCLLSVCDYIFEFIPSSQNHKDSPTFEVMTSRPRLDIYMNLPALQKLDTMLLDILESFRDTEFWYSEQGSLTSNTTKSGSFRKIIYRNEEKWWLPVPCVRPCGISEKSRKQLQHKRDCANQIHKAAMAINSTILADMELPDSYMTSLPKSGRTILGDSIYRSITTPDKFSPDYLLDSLNITSEHEALEIADRVEASMHTWRRKACTSYSKSSWNKVKDFMADIDKSDKNYVLASRAESLLLSLKQRYPELSQTSLDTTKIQCNRDVGQAVLESYSRVLEGLAYNVVAWIEDVFYVDNSTKHQNNGNP
ncbi:hypothetical protein GIB67_022792 [Kingdonia uniflora]|uniref:Rop guanine nucleotide exchange factor 3 n=1 Tax=Kingdonia uniflora TaxID=39325 RepID=A0A7J7P6Q1_9MAGN|nr:hypothetical protein GIB67_022792 [Kingdonia uniflora]